MIIELGRADDWTQQQAAALRQHLLDLRAQVHKHGRSLPVGGKRIAAAALADWLGHAADDLDLDGEQ